MCAFYINLSKFDVARGGGEKAKIRGGGAVEEEYNKLPRKVSEKRERKILIMFLDKSRSKLTKTSCPLILSNRVAGRRYVT